MKDERTRRQPRPKPAAITNSDQLTSTYQWRKLRAAFEKHCRTMGLPCWQCRQPINYDAPAKTPRAFEPDHYIPVKVRPDLAYSWNNLRPSCCRCNSSRQDDDPSPNTMPGKWIQADW